MIEIQWTDRRGTLYTMKVDSVKLWEARGGGREHPDGTVIEGFRGGHGVLQLDVHDRVGCVTFYGVEG